MCFSNLHANVTAGRAVQALFLCVFLVLLSGCWVFSINPLYEENSTKDPDLTFDERLIGSWGRMDDGCMWTLTIKAEQQVYELTSMPAPECKNDEKAARYEGHLVKLNAHYFLDVAPRHEDVCDLCIPVRSILLVQLDGRSLAFAPIDYNWLKKAIESKTVSLQVLPDRDYTLASPTEALKEFVRKHADDSAVFEPDPDLVFQRRPMPAISR